MRLEPAHGLPDLPATVGQPHGTQAVDSVDERRVDTGNPKVVVDHQYRDHRLLPPADMADAEVPGGRFDAAGVTVIRAPSSAPC